MELEGFKIKNYGEPFRVNFLNDKFIFLQHHNEFEYKCFL